MNGSLNMNQNLIKNLGDPVDSTDAVNRKYIDTNFVTKVSRGTTADGDLDINNHRVIDLDNPIRPSDAATKDYADTKISKDGGYVNASLMVTGTLSINNPVTPLRDNNVATVGYMDENFVKYNNQIMNGPFNMNNNPIIIQEDPVNLNDGVNLGYLRKISGNVTAVYFKGIMDSSLTTQIYGRTISGRWNANINNIAIQRGLFVIGVIYEVSGIKKVLMPPPSTLTAQADQLYGSYMLDDSRKIVASSTFISGSSLLDREINVTVYIAIA